jgi:lysozyme
MKFLSFLMSLIYIGSCIGGEPLASHSTAASSFEIKGIDISKYQGTVDFQKVKAAGISYIFIRATEGNTYQDPNFESNFSSSRAAGLATGVYHFYETNDEPLSQLKNFKSIVTLRPGDLPPVIDIEKLHNQDKSNLVGNIKVFLNGLEFHYGVKPILYSGHNFSNEYLTQFGDYPLWLAEYEVDKLNLPVGWSNWTFWQWSQSTDISGIEGKVDADRFNGDELGFRNLLIK